MKCIAQPQYIENCVKIFELPAAAGANPLITLGPSWSADILAMTGDPNDVGGNYFGPNSALIYEDHSGVSTTHYLFVAFTSQNNIGAVCVFDLGALLKNPPAPGTTPAELQSALLLPGNPLGMAIQPGTGDLYVGTTSADWNNGIVTSFTRTPGTTGTRDKWGAGSAVLTEASNAIAGAVSNLAFDLHGNLWLTTFDNGGNFLCCFPTTPANPSAPPSPGTYLKFMNGTIGEASSLLPATSLSSSPVPPSITGLYPFSGPEGIAFDPAGNLWLANNNEEYLDDVNPKTGGSGGGSLMMISGAWLESLLYPTPDPTASTGGLAITTATTFKGSSPVTTYFLNDAAQFGGLCFDGYTLYINDENNYKSSSDPVVWLCDTSYLVGPGTPDLGTFQASLQWSNVTTTYEGNGSMSICNYPYPNPTLTIRDVAGDVGNQPDLAAGSSGDDLWESPDILVSNTSDPPSGVTYNTLVPLSPTPATPSFTTSGTVVSGSPAYISVRVSNYSQATPSTGTEVLKVYYGFASTGLDWPAPWDGSTFYESQPNLPLGGVIGEIPLTTIIPPNQEMYVQIVWPADEIPDPTNYVQAAGGSISESGHFCLLARIESTSVYPFEMCFPEEVGSVSTPTALHDNVYNNSAIGWRNIAITSVSSGETFGPYFKLGVLGANYGPDGRHFTFGIQTLNRDGEVAQIKSRVVVKAEGKALERLLATEFEEHRFKQIDAGRFELLDTERGMAKIHLPSQELLPFTVEFTPEEDVHDFVVRVIQYLHTDGVEKVFGGQTFVIGNVKGFPRRETRDR